MTEPLKPLAPPTRLLLGPGPSPVPGQVLQAMAQPVLGHMDPAFIGLMDETMEALRRIFRTSNPMTFPISASGSSGMEAAVTNLLEPGDRIVVGICGFFGSRLAEMGRRCGARVAVVEAPWGRPVDPERIASELKSGPAKAVALVHGETSTGVRQPLDEIAGIARERDALLIVDAVASLGGVPLETDRLGAAIIYSGSQKCLSAPPGISPITVSGGAMEVVRARKEPVSSWSLDLTLLERYWTGEKRAYHHTAPVSQIYALREACRLALEEGMEVRWARHADAQEHLLEGLGKLGLDLFVEPEHRLPTLTAVRIPDGVDDAALRGRLLHEEGIEIAGGLGPQAGRIWRIGLMGHGARRENVDRLLAALRKHLNR